MCFDVAGTSKKPRRWKFSRHVPAVGAPAPKDHPFTRQVEEQAVPGPPQESGFAGMPDLAM